jgi:hypothetical protein
MHEQPVVATEALCRYVMDKNYFRKSDLRVKPNAFMPAKNGEVSVYRIDDLERSEIFDIGTKYVAELRRKPLLGYASVKASVPMANGLRISGTAEPHPCHANITGWPGGSADRLIAMKLAEFAQFEFVTSPDAQR